MYAYNSLNKKFSETQINKFVNELISKPVKDVTSKFPVLSTNQSSFMYHESKQPRLFFVVSFASSQSLQLTLEAESAMSLAIRLWDSLNINALILDNLSGKGKKNSHNYRFISDGAEGLLSLSLIHI